MSDITAQQLEALKNLNVIVAIDTSGSMSAKDGKAKNRLQRAAEDTMRIAGMAGQFDDDGIDLLTFGGSKCTHLSNASEAMIASALAQEPMGGTPLHLAINKIDEIAKASSKACVAVIITDGEPADQGAVVTKIKSMAAEAHAAGSEKVNMLFIQTGDDPAAAAFLAYLDDNIADSTHADIVDTKSAAQIGEMSMAEVLLAALND